MNKMGCALIALAWVSFAFVGIVKFMAWWNIANGACS